jgi:uncharacterized cofD-like protein
MAARGGVTANAEPLRIVAIGGGTGLSTLLHGLKHYMHCEPNAAEKRDNLDITAVVTVTDDGGSSGRLRRDFDVLPPGDIRNCLVAMSEDEALLSRLFQYRFDSGKGLKGHTMGNLFLTALTHLTGDFAKAVQHASDVLATCGRIYPSTETDVALQALLADGTRIDGETRISQSRQKIKRVRLKPLDCKPLPETLQAIAEADLITLGPGSLFTSVIPNVLVKGMASAIQASPAIKAYFINLMWQPGETLHFSASDHVRAIYEHAGKKIIDIAVINTKTIPAPLQDKYAMEEAMPVENDVEQLAAMGLKVVGRDLAAGGEKVRHDPEQLAEAAIQLAVEGRRKRLRAKINGRKAHHRHPGRRTRHQDEIPKSKGAA